MIVRQTRLPGVLLLEPAIFQDERGFFYERFNRKQFMALTGVDCDFVQDNHSLSRQHVLRGLHYQVAPHAQGKLVEVVHGEVFDVVVDIRPGSPTCGQWSGTILNAKEHRQLWIPPGLAHGFLTLSQSAELLYKTTDYWSPEHERTIRWDDPVLAIDWPLTAPPIISAKDKQAMSYQGLS
ncbi:dTDP-4-dehydrorhamnose 3,5-epimerase [Herbaspirillum sp. YR522]|uniref:dTDP-4-dehydrorhamnose 3,5-epimerase n=1 Tax=Herbaspirillum sp. YR522 TaxID=1144342 RepID=UPI00026F889B|nr:dTDP-4-dehydrorhamnose 3,5-epimerase [Herbaspirillum sp. YR522]EJN00849.1 dTDP-4-dehydrorhamnose 3,5-epimerase [Herbaspirillum sp. YR522]